MPAKARIGDKCSGVCSIHGGPPQVGVIVAGSGDVKVNGQGAARIGDIATFPCGHTGNIIAGSATVNVNGIGCARLGDSIGGAVIGSIIQGSSNVNSGD